MLQYTQCMLQSTDRRSGQAFNLFSVTPVQKRATMIIELRLSLPLAPHSFGVYDRQRDRYLDFHRTSE